MKSGIYYDLPEDQYHADPCVEPSLSSSIAKTLLFDTAAKAKWNHPRLNQHYRRKVKENLETGDALHALLLEGRDKFEIIEAKNKKGEPVTTFQSKEAQEKRDAARAAGKIPVFRHKYDELHYAAAAIRHRFTQLDRPIPFTAGRPEVTLIWEEPCGIWCRARLDWLREDYSAIEDLKTTELSADPGAFGRFIWRNGLQIQAAFYQRGLSMLANVDAPFLFVPTELAPPNLVSRVTLDAAGWELAHAQVDRAIHLFRDCMARDEWPGHPLYTTTIETPAFQIAQWEAHNDES